VSERTPLVAPADDPRARGGIERAKALGGLAGFLIGGLAAIAHGTAFVAAERALAGGVTGYLLGWVVALAAWRRIMRAESEQAFAKLRERAEQQAADTVELS